MKNDNKERLLEVMGKVNPDFNENIEDWAIFRISYGHKAFVTAVENDRIFQWYEDIKYNHPNVLKFSFEKAKNIVENSAYADELYGIVNHYGHQWIRNYMDKFWRKK